MNKTSFGRTLKRKAAVLPYLPANKIKTAWLTIVQAAIPQTPTILKFKHYFETQWFQKVTADVISCSEDKFRTNNALEGWHHRLNTLLPKTPNIFLFLKCLRQEANNSDYQGSDKSSQNNRNTAIEQD